MAIVLQHVSEAPPTNHPFEVRPHHCGLSVPDLEAAIAWYREMLGFSLEIRQEMTHVPSREPF